MKAITNIIITLFILGSVSYASAQCGPTSVEPAPEISGLCVDDIATINFTVQGTCSGNYEYQIVNSVNGIVESWSTNSLLVFAPMATDTFTVFARCSDCPTTVVSEDFIIEVIPAPIIVADTFVCHGSTVDFTASLSAPGTMSWWDSPIGGTQLSSNENYTSPPMTASDTFYIRVDATITGSATQGSILITECGLHGFPGATDADYLEISNLYGTSVNTAGWVVAVSGSYNNINTRNSLLWHLPASFTECSILSKTDVSSHNNYWGNNILWNPNSPGWAAVVDDVGNLVDFVAWGWTAGQLATFNVNINGFNVTLGSQWTGNGCNADCGLSTSVPYSLSRTGNSDNNNAGDFICQPSSLNIVNPGLNCGWVSSDITCPYPAVVIIDSLPSASTPLTTKVSCHADVPAPDPSIITDAADDHSIPPLVIYMGESTSGSSCPETLTRTYRVMDSCSNFVDVFHTIIINDTVAPVMDPAPADLNISCHSAIPPLGSLNWTDNCTGSGSVLGVEVSSGPACPEVLTRTWTIADDCGNTTTRTQVITINDTTPPVIDAAPADLNLQCPSDITPMTSLNWSDNCSGSGVLAGVEVSDGQSCPETITRTWTVTDNCGNTSTETQIIIINDDIPPTASNLPMVQLAVLPPADISLITDAADNCGTPLVEWVSDSSDNRFCPEKVIRTYSVTDDCGNVTYVTHDFIIGEHKPKVSFTADPTILDNFSSGIVEFENLTTGAVTYSWDFGDNSPLSNEIHPSHKFDISVTTSYGVWLTATSELGCSDSTRVPIIVFQELLYYVPNAFTPNGDEINQNFKPIFAAGFDVNDYKLLIFNRWGQILFESNDYQIGWDGTYNGKIAQEGTYVYKIEFGMETNKDRKVVTGSFSLIK